MPLIRPDDFAQDLEDREVPKGIYDLRLVKAEYKLTKKGDNHGMSLAFKIEGEAGEKAKLVNLFLTVPKDGEEASTNRMRMREIKRLLTVLGVDFSDGFDPETQTADLVGLTASNVTLDVEEYEGEMQNRLRLPRLTG
jgi:hypothetical protein